MIPLSLASSEVHVWIAHLDSLFYKYEQYKQLLSEEEKKQESRFAFDHLRKRFAIRRAVLKEILRKYISYSPLLFSHTSYGKPFLVENSAQIEFNMSHSNEIAIYAITKNVPIGVDVEYLQKRNFDESLLDLVLSKKEKALFDQLDASSKILQFFTSWTRKEALVKAIGLGLNIPLPDIEIIEENASLQIRWKGPQWIERYQWQLVPIPDLQGYVGALAVTNKTQCCYFHFTYNEHGSNENEEIFRHHKIPLHPFQNLTKIGL